MRPQCPCLSANVAGALSTGAIQTLTLRDASYASDGCFWFAIRTVSSSLRIVGGEAHVFCVAASGRLRHACHGRLSGSRKGLQWLFPKEGSFSVVSSAPTLAMGLGRQVLTA